MPSVSVSIVSARPRPREKANPVMSKRLLIVKRPSVFTVSLSPLIENLTVAALRDPKRFALLRFTASALSKPDYQRTIRVLVACTRSHPFVTPPTSLRAMFNLGLVVMVACAWWFRATRTGKPASPRLFVFLC